MPTRAKPKSPLQGVNWPIEPFLVATLPLPPGINGSYNTNHGAQFFSSVELKQFKQDALMVLAYSTDKAVVKNWNVVDAIRISKQHIPLDFSIDFYFKTLWKRDIDGGIKAVQDVVFKYLDLNDNLVVRLPIEKWADRDNPRCEISVRVCTERIGE